MGDNEILLGDNGIYLPVIFLTENHTSLPHDDWRLLCSYSPKKHLGSDRNWYEKLKDAFTKQPHRIQNGNATLVFEQQILIAENGIF